MKIHLVTLGDSRWSERCRAEFEAAAARDRFGQHGLTDAPGEADLILFIDFHLQSDDWWLSSFHRHPLVKAYPDKICVYDERDRPWFTAPGVYVSLARSSHPQSCQASGCYFNFKVPPAPDPNVRPDLLFSFMGSLSHPIRREVVKLSHPRAVVEDTSGFNFFAATGDEEARLRIQRQKERFAEVTARSKFILCPRGIGTSSFRAFETLSLGRVPVIISDDWVPVPGPQWDKCAIIAPEADIAALPRLLEEREAEFETLAANGRATWDEWFAPEVRFHRLVETCRALQAHGRGTPGHPWLQSAALDHLVRLKKHRLRKALQRH